MRVRGDNLIRRHSQILNLAATMLTVMHVPVMNRMKKVRRIVRTETSTDRELKEIEPLTGWRS